MNCVHEETPFKVRNCQSRVSLDHVTRLLGALDISFEGLSQPGHVSAWTCHLRGFLYHASDQTLHPRICLCHVSAQTLLPRICLCQVSAETLLPRICLSHASSACRFPFQLERSHEFVSTHASPHSLPILHSPVNPSSGHFRKSATFLFLFLFPFPILFPAPSRA